MSKSIIGEKHLKEMSQDFLKRERTYKRIVLFEKYIQSFDFNTYVEDCYRISQGIYNYE